MIITCPKCGQALMNEDDRALTDAEAAELALQTCKFPAARAWQSKEKQIDEACFNIESLCVANARELGMTEIENDEIIDILKKTARLIADAKVFDKANFIRLPCKINAHIFVIPTKENRLEEITEMKVKGFAIGEPCNVANCFRVRGSSALFQPSFEEFGKTVFLTCEEAEQALKGRD